MKFLSSDVAFISIKLPYGLAYNVVVIFELFILAATWIFEISYENGYVTIGSSLAANLETLAHC